MPKSSAVLIVGVDSLIGRHVAARFAADGIPIIGTTRRRESLAENRLFLDFDQQESFQNIPQSISVAILCAAASGYAASENNPASNRINVEAPIQLAAQLMARGIFTVFLSTNAVFSGRQPLCDENAEPDPETTYGKQKTTAEAGLQRLIAETGYADSLAIVRLTKVVSWDTPTFVQWKREWAAGRPIKPFTDLNFSPIGLDYVAEGLKRLIDKRCSGTFQFTGNENISYAEFGQRLAPALRIQLPTPVQPLASTDVGVKLAHRPRYATMRGDASLAKLGLVPQTVANVVEELCKVKDIC